MGTTITITVTEGMTPPSTVRNQYYYYNPLIDIWYITRLNWVGGKK